MNEQQQQTVIAGLKALGETTRHAAASPTVEDAILAEFARLHRAPTGNVAARRAPGAAWLAIAATLMLASASGIWFVQRAAGRVEAPLMADDFMDIPTAAYLPPMESGSIVRTELPLSALPSYGIQIVPEMATDSVDVDLLVAQDGLPRGIRLVNNSHSRSTP